MSDSKKITNPFPGLRPFESDEYRLFFGREGQSDALIARLQRSHFLAVVGTSGSGKSSLVRAGLLPALRGGMMAGAGSGWRIAIMRPGSDPIGNLAIALADKDVLLEAGAGLSSAETAAVIEASLRRGSLGLVEVARQGRLAAHEKLLVVVDQFEELFRFRAARASSSTGDEASAFVKLLLEASQQQEFSIYVVPTMRSDFLGDCAQFQGLPEAINDGQYLIPRMNRDERRFAITGPVGVTRGKITEPLVNRLMNDVGDNPDQLPILQHALMRTWGHWATYRRDGEPIGLEHYEAVGTMSDALSEHADEAFNELPDDRSRLIAETVFKALTERGADNREIRRPTCLKDICDIADASAQEVTAVVDVFRGGGRSFLMPPADVELEPETVIDISHESLIRNWRRLKEWVKDEAESARIYRRLAGAATDYRAGAGGLLDDVTLQYVLKWREKSKPDRAWGERYHPEFDDAMAYIEESRAAREARIAGEQERERRELENAQLYAEQQRRSAQRMRRLTAALGFILLFALGTSVYAFVLKQSAEASKRNAEASEQQTRLLAGDLDATRRSVAEAEERARKLQQIAEEKTKKALVDEEKAVRAIADAETATVIAVEARQQAARDKQIAAVNLQIAQKAREEAEENKKQIEEARKRDELLRKSILASRRDDPVEALGFLVELKGALEAFQPGGASSSTLSPERARQFVLDLGWTLSDIGATHQEVKDYREAAKNYEDALAKLRQVLPENSDNQILFSTYHGLGHSYHGLSRSGIPTRDSRVDERTNYEKQLQKAEDFFKKALEFQKKYREKKPAEIATGHLNLARVYGDLGNEAEAVRNYRLAIELWKEPSRNKADSALEELALFHRDAGRYREAADVYNELIVSNEDITVFGFAEKGQGIANLYSELADVYRADSKDKEDQLQEARNKAKLEARELNEEEQKLVGTAEPLRRSADSAFLLADLIQKWSLKLKRTDANAKLNIDTDIDALGDAYVRVGKFSYAEGLYEQALEYRIEMPTKDKVLWKSYDKLTRLYREHLKDDQKAEAYNNGLIELLKDNKEATNRYVESMVQLAGSYAKDRNRYAEAEALYNRALDIALAQDDWQYPNHILYLLGQLHIRQHKTTEWDRVVKQRLEIVTAFYKRLSGPAAQKPKAPINLVAAYLDAIDAAALFQSTVRKNDLAAEAAYLPAFTAYDYISSNIYTKKVLDSYVETLKHYETLLNKQKKPGEAAKVGEKLIALKEKLGQLEKINSQNTPIQSQATANPY